MLILRLYSNCDWQLQSKMCVDIMWAHRFRWQRFRRKEMCRDIIAQNELTRHLACAGTRSKHQRHAIYVSNLLVPGRCGSDFKSIIFKQMLQIKFMSNSCEIAPWWIPKNLFDDKSTLIYGMDWCRQATSHYRSQCWPRSMSPFGVTRLKMKMNAHEDSLYY